MTDLFGKDYRTPAESFWEAERMAGGDGYDVMAKASDEHGWHAVAMWGHDGWDLGDWPYVVVYVRKLDPELVSHAAGVCGGAYEMAYYVEGDVDVYRYLSAKQRERAIDELALFHWRVHPSRYPWADGVESVDALLSQYRGPFTHRRDEVAG
jgi:hypothetical protein